MSIDIHNVAIVGLGRVGTRFLEKILSDDDCCLRVRCVTEIGETPGRNLAVEKDVPVVSLDGVVDYGADIDVIFDFTGDRNVTDILCKKLEESCNNHTKVVQDQVARLIWSLIASDDCLPEVRATKYQAYADMAIARMENSKS